MSEIRNQCLPWSVASPSDSPGMVISVIGSMRGDCLEEPPGTLSKVKFDRYWVKPTARMLTATPETMWLTLNVIVMIACSRPPRAPPTMPMRTPVHGPHW